MTVILKNARVLTAQGDAQAGQSIVIIADKIVWCGADEALPPDYLQTATIEDCQGKLVTPGLIDCHTHLVYAGNRASEFRLRMQGMSYADIARLGGGIISTVQQTRAASEEALLEQSLPRLLALRAQGVTTVEIKSGYGLDLVNELKMLRVAKQLAQHTGLRVKTTFLGAHALAPEFRNQQDAYVDYICEVMLPAIVEADLADFVDVFCEGIAFNLAQTERIFSRAKIAGLGLKCHAEQLSNMGAASLAASMQAVSCDHLEYLDEAGAKMMASNNTTAVLLPGAFYYLQETKLPPMDLLRQYGVKMAIASDANPGSSPTASLLIMMSMACRFFAMQVHEVWQGVTGHAASALGLEKELGYIAPGFIADLVRWDITDEAALCYYFDYPVPHQTMIAGTWVS